jgi:phosphoribosylglycinamide formyltransferase-1
MVKKIIILASGGGSNAENIIHYFQKHTSISIDRVLCNNKTAFVFERMDNLGTPCYWFDASKENVIIDLLASCQPDLIVLAGYLKKIPPQLIQLFPNKIINIHPALLPKFGGKGMYGMHVHKAVKENGELFSGITIHYVNEHYDEGGVIFQERVAINSDDDPKQIAKKVQALEYAHFPKVIENLLS